MRQVFGEDEQAEHDEERDLRGEREPFVERDELAPVAGRRAADGEPDEVDGEEAATAEHVRRAERDRRGGEGRDRCERADRRRDAREDPGRKGAEDDADDEADPDLAHDFECEVCGAVRAGLVLDPGDQPDRQGDRHRVVAAGLGLERARQAPADLGRAQRREDGGRVGRGDHGAEQERLEPGEREQRVRAETGDQRRHEDADGAQQRGRDDDLAQAPPRGLQSAFVEDQAEADRSDALGQLRVVEADAAGPVRAEQHPDAEKRDEDGQAGARGAERGDDARAEHDADKEEDEPFVHAPISALACERAFDEPLMLAALEPCPRDCPRDMALRGASKLWRWRTR